MATIKLEFSLEGHESLSTLGYCLIEADKKLELEQGLTLTVSDVILEKNPLGNNKWQFKLKA